MDTIHALASGQGKSGVAVIRLSGPQASEIVQRLAGRVPPPRQMSLARLRNAAGELLDEALVVLFPEGKSFTGEPVVELHLHGSPAVITAVLRELDGLGLSRLAEPGEFTRRALENGRLDLTEVEALADLIQAETEAQRRQAVAALSGALGQKVAAWREKLVHCLALVAVGIDFADEDVPEEFDHEIEALVRGIIGGLEREIAGVQAAERIRDGFKVAILGRPNVGKSTLLNALAGREAALTSEIAGTTRDVIEVRMDIGGLPVTLLDTAGLRETDDVVEKMGVARAIDRAISADLRILLTEDGTVPQDAPVLDGDIVLKSKQDTDAMPDGVSGLTGAGVDRLVQRVHGILSGQAAQAGSASHDRHRRAMARAKEALESALHEIGEGSDRSEFLAESLRRAAQALDELIGRVDVEDILDDIFRNFCLGK